MKIKKEYEYSNRRQIWRLIPTDSGKIIIEDRNVETKEAFFNCLDIYTGKKKFSNLQLDEKYWIGIETIYKDIIFFHKYLKPDMPGHIGIIAYDTITQKVLWNTEEFIFLFILENKLYGYRQMFEGRKFYTLDYRNGEMIEELGEDAFSVNIMREEAISRQNYEGYFFPEYFDSKADINDSNKILLEEFYESNFITGKIEFVNLENLLLLSYHKPTDGNSLENKFAAIDILSKKTIFEVTLNARVNAFVPDSFFVKDELIFLLIEKEKLLVCSLKE